jgi:hypothetical protein
MNGSLQVEVATAMAGPPPVSAARETAETLRLAERVRRMPQIRLDKVRRLMEEFGI